MKKTACPITLAKKRMVPGSEMDVYATFTNISKVAITAIGFKANHTDKFGDTYEPYRTELTSEDLLRPGHSQSMHWQVLMEEHTAFHHPKGQSELYIHRVAFSDGRVLEGTDLEGCDFIF